MFSYRNQCFVSERESQNLKYESIKIQYSVHSAGTEIAAVRTIELSLSSTSDKLIYLSFAIYQLETIGKKM